MADGNPRHLSNPALVHAAAQIAAQRGIPRQDPQFLQFIGQLLDQHAAAQTQAAPPPMPLPMPPMPPVTHIDIEKTESPEGEPESAHMDAHFVSAPPSRGARHSAGRDSRRQVIGPAARGWRARPASKFHDIPGWPSGPTHVPCRRADRVVRVRWTRTNSERCF